MKTSLQCFGAGGVKVKNKRTAGGAEGDVTSLWRPAGGMASAWNG
jgi:hypothetical protein